jgi:hypothetical protein
MENMQNRDAKEWTEIQEEHLQEDRENLRRLLVISWPTMVEMSMNA